MPKHVNVGDLLASSQRAGALARGANCRGAMGTGLVVGFLERRLTVFVEHRRRCPVVPRELKSGDPCLWKKTGS